MQPSNKCKQSPCPKKYNGKHVYLRVPLFSCVYAYCGKISILSSSQCFNSSYCHFTSLESFVSILNKAHNSFHS